MSIVGIGIDVVGLSDFDAIVRRGGARFLDRVYTPSEIASVDGLSAKRRLSGLAAGFAAKEAAFKALGTGWSGQIRWQDVELEGGTKLVLHGEFQRQATAHDVQRIHTSVSKGPDIVSALVVLAT